MAGNADPRPTYVISRTLFVRLVGIVYLIAFVSLWAQLDGLVGDRGILPVADYLAAAEEHFSSNEPPASAIWSLPTLLWISPHDGMLHLLCAVGAFAAAAVILGWLPVPALVVTWACYLSLFHGGQIFLGFQWDVLLLETGFLAVFMAPLAWRSRGFADPPPPRIALWLVWWLLFRLMLESGAVKLTWNRWDLGADGEPVANAWASLTAMTYHYWTQPLPGWTSWYAARLPLWIQKLSVVGVLAVELILPFFIFGPRRLRQVAFVGIAALMILIAATGSYNFFNLLTIILALTLLDDRAWPESMRRGVVTPDRPAPSGIARAARNVLLAAFALLAVVLGTLQLKTAILPPEQRSRPLETRLRLNQFVLVNGYGLFRRMTETRPEIEIEGSSDGRQWTPYAFRWKPGNPARAPLFATPHQPRLDWQMWFEALRFERVHRATGTVDARRMSPWFRSFLMRLMQGEAEVLELLDDNPFPQGAPSFIRVVLYRYRFTDSRQREASGEWWQRERVWTGAGWRLPPERAR